MGIVLANTYCTSSVTNVLHSDQYILPSFVLVELNTRYDGDWFQFGLLFSPKSFDYQVLDVLSEAICIALRLDNSLSIEIRILLVSRTR